MSNANELEPFATQTENDGEVGRQLRKARKICGLSVEMVALQLHIDPRVIKALEEDDFSQLMPVFVRGYLRNYARLVNLPAEPLLESYDRIVGAEKLALQPTRRSSKRSNTRWGVYLSVAALSVPVFLWAGYEARLRFGAMSDGQSGTGRAITSEAPTPPTGEVAPATPSEQATAAVSPTHQVTAGPDPGGSKTVSTTPSASPTSAENAAADAIPSGLTHEPANRGETAETVQPTSAATPAMPVSSPPVGEGPDNLTVHVSADAWVAIRDHRGHRLAYETMPAGSSRAYFGHAPFRVVLGNSPATRLDLNGQPFEHPKPRTGIVARFQAGHSRNESTGSTGIVKETR